MADLTIVQLVEGLQPDLLHQQATQRCRAVSTIAMILEHLGPNLEGLNDKEIELITEFFCSKLKDHHSIIPAALQGLHALVINHIFPPNCIRILQFLYLLFSQSTAPKLPTGLPRMITQAIFQDVHCQSQLQSDRRAVYKTLKNLLTFHLKGTKRNLGA